MKRIILSIFACCAFVFMASAQDRLDFITKDGKINSAMVDLIDNIRYARSNDITADNGYDQIIIKLIDGKEIIWDLNENNEVLYKTPTNEWLEIARTNDDHSWVVMYDCINNEGVMDPDKPVDWTAERCGKMPHFNYFAEKGFDPYYTLTGQYSGTVYSDIYGYVWWSLPEDNRLGIATWSFVMPNEPVTIAVTSVERTTYKDAPFLGEYKGFPIKIGDKRLYKGTDPVFSVLLKANETYTLKTTDENNFSYVDWYRYNEEKNSFSYQGKDFDGLHGVGDTVYGAHGQFFNDNDVLVDIYNLSEDKPENTKYYFGSRDVKKYVCAAKDDYGFEFLLESTDSKNAKKWYFVTNYGMKKMEANVDFNYGSSIGDICEGYISYDGEIQMKYTLGYNSAPEFVRKGGEAGTYKSTDTETYDYDMILDGFGVVNMNGKEYNYTVDGNMLTVNVYGDIFLFEIDRDAMTYTPIKSSVWNGPKLFSNDEVYGCYAGDEPTRMNTAYVALDKSIMDEERLGYAKISINILHNGAYCNAVEDCQKYIWQKEKNNLIITNVLVGTYDGGCERKNLIFHISDDMQKMYLTGDSYQTTIYAKYLTDTYVNLNEDNALAAPQAAELADVYTGTFKVLNFGQESGEAECTLNIDKDTEGNDKAGYAAISAPFMGAFIMNATAKYSVEGSSLILHDVTVGDGNYGTKTEDITFTITSEGNLIGNAAYYGPDMMTAFMQIDFSKGTFAPAAPKFIEIPDANFKKYLVDNFDKDGDGEISPDEAAAIEEVKCPTNAISSVKGIEAMPNLVSISLAGGTIGGILESIDVTANKKLMWLTITNNKITSIDLSQNTELDGLWAGDNPLESLDVTANKKITTLKIYNTNIQSIDLSNNTELKKFECHDCNMLSLDLTKNTKLKSLNCSFAHLSGSIDLSNNTKLTSLYINGNPDLTTIWMWEGFDENDYYFMKDDTAEYMIK